MENKKSGVVIWYDEVKGYGFIKQDDGGEDLFVHFRDVVNNEKTLNILIKNQNVIFEVADGTKGPVAKSVELN